MLHHSPNDKTAKKPAAHGPEFKAWGRRASQAFAHRGIEVTTRHSYDIDYKFAWRCGECATEVQRHSRSVDPRRHRCGRCRGLLAQIRPVPRGGAGGGASAAALAAAALAESGVGGVGGESGNDSCGNGNGNNRVKTKRQPSAWQEFLTREMKDLSVSQKGLSFEKKMEIVSGKWKVVRDAKGKKDGKDVSSNSSGGGGGGGGNSTKDITEGVKALEIEDDDAAAAAADATAITATADGEDEDDNDVVIISSSG